LSKVLEPTSNIGRLLRKELPDDIPSRDAAVLREAVDSVALAAERAEKKSGVLEVRSERTESGAQKIVSRRFVRRAPGGRPREVGRELLALYVADSLERAGIRATKARTGTFAKILPPLLHAAGLFVPTDIHRIVFRAVDMTRWIQQGLQQ
jgi:hypothetical protein